MTCETRHADRGKTDNPKTVTIEHIARIAVRHPQMVELGRHYGCVVTTCEPFDPESKGGVETTVKIAKADLVPTHANLRAGYGSFAELEAACAAWSEQVNGRRHRETHRPPIEMPAEERTRLHVLPADPYRSRSAPSVWSVTTGPSAGVMCAIRCRPVTRAARSGAASTATSWRRCFAGCVCRPRTRAKGRR